MRKRSQRASTEERSQESFRQDTEDKKEAITGIGDDHIREDGMGVPAAFADQPEDRDFLYNGLPMDKIDDAAGHSTHGHGSCRRNRRWGRPPFRGRKKPYRTRTKLLMIFLYELTCKKERFFLS